MIRRVWPLLEHKAGLRGVQLEAAVDEKLPLIYGDGEKLGRVVINLVVNAIKFCGQPGTVRLWAKESSQDREVIVGVTDDGTGIAEENLRVIFERFKRVETDVDRSRSGFGLGLNIVRELVELNLGTVRVESTVGQGSTFSFSIPCAEPVEVTRRFLRRIAMRFPKSKRVSLVIAELDESAEERQCDEVEAFLNCQLRRNDVLFRSGQRSWLMLLLAPEIELELSLERFQAARTAVNRNRPYGPLPEIRYGTDDSRRVVEDADAILARVQDCCSLAEACCE